MRVPTRRGELRIQKKIDPYITQEKYDELKTKLDKIYRDRPKMIEEVDRLAQMGDFSENAAYQMAKGKLRGMNSRILEIENQLNHAEIIELNKNSDTVQVGHQVTLESNGKTKTYRILGSTETDPTAGVISRHSPLGSALIGKKVGEKASVQLATGKTVEYKIIKIE